MTNDLVEQALPFRAEMRDDDDREPGIGWQSAEEALKRLDPSSRSAYTDHGKG
jgi:hypothetical protein